jgi:antitoxin MazE
MRVEIIKIGNSKGLRIPKAFLEQCGMKDIVNLTVEDHTLIIKPYKEVRKGWDEAFQRMSANKDDVLLDDALIHHSWDEEDWEW